MFMLLSVSYDISKYQLLAIHVLHPSVNIVNIYKADIQMN